MSRQKIIQDIGRISSREKVEAVQAYLLSIYPELQISVAIVGPNIYALRCQCPSSDQTEIIKQRVGDFLAGFNRGKAST